MAGFWETIFGGTSSSGRSTDIVATRGTEVLAEESPASGDGISYSVHAPRVVYLEPDEWAAEVAAIWSGVKAMTPGELWKTQPHLRTVVSFVARNIAQVGLHVFERMEDNDRRRDRTNDFARALSNPGDRMTTYRLIFALVGDKMLYDRAYWLPWTDDKGRPRIRRIPPSWVKPAEKSAFGIDTYKIHLPGGVVPISADRLLAFDGYSPTTATGCSPTVEALKDTLAEQIEATKYRSQVWRRGGRVSSVLKRPADAPQWTDTQAQRFREDWYAAFTGDGPQAGGTPILEDGMDIAKVDFSAKDMEWAAGATLSFATVASAYHVNPTMVGILENANYSNVREFRKMLYGDTLGPYFAELEGDFNTFALPFFGIDEERFYAEFNIREKLQGSFEEEASVLSTAVGAPHMTRNEARSRQNLPAVEGGDELIVPLNVLIGGQASPRDGVTAGRGGGSVEDAPPAEPAKTGLTPGEIGQLVNAAAALIRSGFEPTASLAAVGLDPVDHLGLLPVTVQRPEAPENPDQAIEDALKSAARVWRKHRAGRRTVKARAPEPVEAKVAQAVSAFFDRQARVVKTALGGKADGWWDGERWDRELSHDLMALATLVTKTVAASVLDSIGFGPDVYDEARTLAWLKEVSDRSASSLNETTRAKIEAALADADDPEKALDGVFAAQESRALEVAASSVTLLSAFAAVEATKQAVGDEATKTWVTGKNARPRHAALNGETVALSENFSNGAAWPGDGSALGADDLAGCNCELEINIGGAA